MGSCIFKGLQVQTTCKQCAVQIAKLIEAGGMETPPTYNLLNSNINFILLHEKFLHFHWLTSVVFPLNLKYLLVKITNLLWMVV